MVKVVALVALDYCIIFSCTLLALYLAALFLASCIPEKMRPAPSSLGIPLVALLSAALMLTPWEPFLTTTLRWLTVPVFSADQQTTDMQHMALLAVWLAGTAALLLLFITRTLALFCAIRDSKDVSRDPVFTDAQRRINLRRTVRVKCSPAFQSVASWVLFRAYVLVPEDFEKKYNDAERYALYLHELTHIKNRDSLKCLLAGTVAAVFWFNPVSVHALRRFKNHIEVACDRAVIGLGIDPAAYADLVGRFIAAKRRDTPALHFSSAYKDAARRFRYIFNDPSFLPAREDRRMAIRFLAVFGLVAALALGFPREDAGRFPKSGQTVEREFPGGEVVREYYVFARQGVIGRFSRSRVVGRGFAETGDLTLPQGDRSAPPVRIDIPPLRP